jgi:DGQHR domain-containing protein
MSNPIIPRTSSKTLISQPSYGVSPSGFERLHIEMLPREVGRLLGYDPRVLVMRPRRTRELVPHNVSPEIIKLQNSVQRSIDKNRVAQMVSYLVNAMESEAFADWGSIELVTSAKPDVSKLQTEHVAGLPSDADYFIADGQHRYCALMDFVTQYPQYADRFTQSVTISILPVDKLEKWAGQAFHDRNYFSVPVRAGKALSVDTRDPINALAKDLAQHPAIQDAGGIAYERDTLLKNDQRFASHTMLHRFVRGFVFGRPGLDKGVDTRQEINPQAKENLEEYFNALGLLLPWKKDTQDRDIYLTRTSAVLSALSVIGHDLYFGNLTPDQKVSKLSALAKIDWRRDNRNLIGVVGSEKDGIVMPTASRQAIDSTIRYVRDRLGIKA